MKLFNKLSGILLLTGMLATSCVPSRMFDETKTAKLKCEEENARIKTEQLAMQTQLEENAIKKTEMEREMTYLRTDTSTLGTGNRRLTQLYNELTSSYDKLVANNDKLLASNQGETKKIINQLQMTQEELLRKEDSLKVREKYLAELNDKLKLREAKVDELQQILTNKDNEVKLLKENVTNALMGFNNKGLTIEQRNGKVYVSLEEQLLFASGSIIVDPKGAEALSQLSNVLAKNVDINVLIEGHTDNVPIKGGAIKDNWDLSVLRATSVVRILTKSSNIDPKRLTPAGRGEYVPIDTANTPAARKKNRRIEVILSPNLDELIDVLKKD